METNEKATVTSPFLSYDLEKKTHRSARDEWPPHQTQSDRSVEWWYFTAQVHDAAGTPYFLFWDIFNNAGKRYFEQLPPQLAAQIKPGQAPFSCEFTLTNYKTGIRRAEGPIAIVMKEDAVWDGDTSTLRLNDAQHECVWSYDGEHVHLAVTLPTMAFDLEMQGGSQVMWAKDQLGAEGLIQEGPEGEYSFYYSLPRLRIAGSLTYADEGGQPTTVEVGGSGWVDRQWGEFLTKDWEWGSFRFNNGARLNLYNFYNGHQVATYQKADGSLHWFDHFHIKQNGYARTPGGIWVSWGWSYEFPIEVEGSRRYTLVPFSTIDMVESPGNAFFEGPSQLIDETTGKQVGISVNESMDVRVMGNAPYGVHQH
jgi:predicted secreted hydrolase